MQNFFAALLLILAANSAPILIRLVPMCSRWNYPLDCNLKFFDGQPLLGHAKTWRGLAAAILLTVLCAVALRLGWFTGIMVALTAMLGDSLSSFIKRRLALAPSTMAPGLDQIPESLVPGIYLKYAGLFDWGVVWLLVAIFVVMDLTMSRLLFRLHIRKRPY